MQKRITALMIAVLLMLCAACTPTVDSQVSISSESRQTSSAYVESAPSVGSTVTSSTVESGSQTSSNPFEENPFEENPPAIENELRGMWIAFFELSPMFDESKDFSAEFASALDKCVESGFNAVYVHVRSHCDAFYESEYYPWSMYCNGVDSTQGVNPGFDPLEIMVNLAHERGLEFHAWINPYRVLKDSTDLAKLADDNPAKVWLTDDDESNDLCVAESNGGLYLNPAMPQVQRLITDGVREIVANYDVDGIHFDDYFYPTTDESFDAAQYVDYRASVTANPLPLADWRRANVNAMVGAVYNAVKAERSDCIFGISPMASITNNYNTVYADIETWLTLGIVDYIMPQLYFGFEYPDEKNRFDNLLKEWQALLKDKPQKLFIGLGSYRVGSTDKDNVEWSQHADILTRQINMLRLDGISDGFVVYSYTTFYKDDELSTTVRNSVESLIRDSLGE